MRIVFMGTPDFAVPTLDMLNQNGFNIVGVITAPDKPAGRGRQLKASPVKEYAINNGLKVLQPTNLKNEAFLDELRSLKADLQVVVAFRMLPVAVWDMPPKGSVNLHASLLPQYRGAAPINWAIINGEKETGCTTFFIEHEIDTGKLIFQKKLDIWEDETAGSLHDRMIISGAELMLKTVQAIEKGDYPQIPQQASQDLKKAPKIFTEDCAINWNQPIEKIYNQIRGLSPYPSAYTELEGKRLKIYGSEKINEAHNLQPGKWETDGRSYLRFAARDGFIAVTDLKLEGKKRMDIKAFLAGWK